MQHPHCVASICKNHLQSMHKYSSTFSLVKCIIFLMQNLKIIWLGHVLIMYFTQKTALLHFIEQISMRATITVKYDFHLVAITQRPHCVARMNTFPSNVRSSHESLSFINAKTKNKTWTCSMQEVHVKCMHGARLEKAVSYERLH